MEHLREESRRTLDGNDHPSDQEQNSVESLKENLQTLSDLVDRLKFYLSEVSDHLG